MLLVVLLLLLVLLLHLAPLADPIRTMSLAMLLLLMMDLLLLIMDPLHLLRLTPVLLLATVPSMRILVTDMAKMVQVPLTKQVTQARVSILSLYLTDTIPFWKMIYLAQRPYLRQLPYNQSNK